MARHFRTRTVDAHLQPLKAPFDKGLRHSRLQICSNLIAQYSHEPYIATVRHWIQFLDKAEAWAERIAERRSGGHAALRIMEDRLSKAEWLAADRLTVADLALAAYTQVADEGGYELGNYPAIRAWLERLFNVPGLQPLPRSA